LLLFDPFHHFVVYLLIRKILIMITIFSFKHFFFKNLKFSLFLVHRRMFCKNFLHFLKSFEFLDLSFYNGLCFLIILFLYWK